MKSCRRVLYTTLILALSNSYLLFCLVQIASGWKVVVCAILVIAFVGINIRPAAKGYPKGRYRVLLGGAELLLLFMLSSLLNLISVILMFILLVPEDVKLSVLFINSLIIIVFESIVFWNGIIRVYCTSVQLGIKTRVIGILVGWIPIANLVALIKIYTITARECTVESEKEHINEARRESEICKTKYPLLLVHGVFFRDIKHLNYWGRIPAELKTNGATIFYGKQQSAASVESSAEELLARIKDIVNKTGCEKVNIIAHSKGGLDARYAISALGADEYVASLTTINTPHRGCIFAQYLLNKAPEKLKNSLADRYNRTLKKLGDQSPDFLAAVSDLTASRCAAINTAAKDKEGVIYQSVASKSNNARSGKFPLNISYPLVRHFDGANDGLVSVESAKWGTKFRLISVTGKRGVTHADVIDLNRENIDGFDVREFYVKLVGELKTMGI